MRPAISRVGGSLKAHLTLALSLLSFIGTANAAPRGTKCVQIYYDYRPDSLFLKTYGRTHAIFLENLLGHFPKIQQHVIPIAQYQKGDLEKCAASFYLGDYFDEAIPAAFLEDFAETKRNVLWAGYDVWKLGAKKLRDLWGIQFSKLASLDFDKPDAAGNPGFFKWFDYKGETFEKYGKKDRNGNFNAAFEIPLFRIDPNDETKVIIWARHSSTNEKTPYVVRDRNHWYVGDVPFSYITEDDRYHAFADLLFDVVNEKPTRQGQKRPALARFEDVHPMVAETYLNAMSEVFERHRASYSIALIPRFADPLGKFVQSPADQFRNMSDTPRFLEYLRRVQTRGASLIWHGYTHQYGEQRNPFSGVSGDDFEFWDAKQTKPVSEDSPDFVVGRLEAGFSLIRQSGMRASAWEAPHYQASPLDYIVFGQLSLWNVGRVTYFPHTATQSRQLPAVMSFDLSGEEYNGQRAQFFKDLKVEVPSGLLPSGQMFPYEIHGDVYGQRVIPENVGNVQPFLSEQVVAMRSVDDMLKTMRRNLVLRDGWASFFLHAVLLRLKGEGGLADTPGDTKELDRLIGGAQAMGYEFINMDQWTRANLQPKRPPTIEVKPTTAIMGPVPLFDATSGHAVRARWHPAANHMDCAAH